MWFIVNKETGLYPIIEIDSLGANITEWTSNKEYTVQYDSKSAAESDLNEIGDYYAEQCTVRKF